MPNPRSSDTVPSPPGRLSPGEIRFGAGHAPDAQASRQGVKWSVALIGSGLVFIALVLFAVAYNTFAFGVTAAESIRPMCFVLTACCLWAVVSWRMVAGSVFNPYGMFLIAASLFNGGQAFLYMFAVDTSALSSSVAVSVMQTFPPQTVLSTVFLVALGITAFHIGGLLSVPVLERRGTRVSPENSGGIAQSGAEYRRTASALRMVGWGLLLVSAGPVVVLLQQSISVVASSGYLGIYQQEFSSSLAILAAAVIPAVVFLLAGSKGHPYIIALATGVVLVYSFAQFFLGNRGGAAMFLVAFAWTFHRCIRPLPKSLLLVAGLIMLLVVFPVIRVFRDQGPASSLSVESLTETFTSIDNPVVSILQETGFSMVTVSHTLELVPGYRDFDFGVSYFYALLGVVPSLFWPSHPTEVHGTLSSWLARAVEPGLASTYDNWGLGYSFIAEAYMNFGWFGTPFVLALTGFLLGWFVLSAERSGDLAKIAMVGTFTGFFLIYARAEANDVIRSLAWYSLFPYLAVLSVKLWTARARGKTVGDNTPPARPPRGDTK
ncbi:O-antigen polysaccharide polymerase Wzy [Rubrobacter indicoceani]|uniref:O-antigen polysaccharide polymerase Wzy n=1 Tax=Rubrobacter indicoceani TaxID=2051957 RepID=UPI000E5BC4FF|nr:O-antigen polysaccharide polymerase Wzy [Rubrobacter indicoceani]